jgi:hypothetical protein
MLAPHRLINGGSWEKDARPHEATLSAASGIAGSTREWNESRPHAPDKPQRKVQLLRRRAGNAWAGRDGCLQPCGKEKPYGKDNRTAQNNAVPKLDHAKDAAV